MGCGCSNKPKLAPVFRIEDFFEEKNCMDYDGNGRGGDRNFEKNDL
jgi:hypothetical protein